MYEYTLTLEQMPDFLSCLKIKFLPIKRVSKPIKYTSTVIRTMKTLYFEQIETIIPAE